MILYKYQNYKLNSNDMTKAVIKSNKLSDLKYNYKRITILKKNRRK